MIENHVTSLELSKKLNELGVKQESEFYWTRPGKEGAYVCWHYEKACRDETKEWERISAFLSSEIGEVLPEKTSTWKAGDYFFCRYGLWDEGSTHVESSETECDARSKMLIYLIENKIIDVKLL